MARPKSNTEIKFHANLRFELLLDEYLVAGPQHAIPEQWGSNPTWRRYYATYLARFSHSPDLLTPTSPTRLSKNNLREECARQVLFARLFALAPDYFLAFVAHFRKISTATSQIEIIAQAIIVEGDELLITADGEERLDKEIAAILEAHVVLGTGKIHPSVIGKARKLIADWYDQERTNRINRYLDEAAVVLNGLDRNGDSAGSKMDV